MKTGSEIAYFRRRMRTSLVMAAAAAGPCAEIAHQTLARLYGEAIETLSPRMQSQPLLLEGPMIGSLHQENLRHAKITDDGRPTMALA